MNKNHIRVIIAVALIGLSIGCSSKEEKLNEAVRKKDVEKVRSLITDGADRNAKLKGDDLTIAAKSLLWAGVLVDINLPDSKEKVVLQEQIISLMIVSPQEAKKVREEWTSSLKSVISLKKDYPKVIFPRKSGHFFYEARANFS